MATHSERDDLENRLYELQEKRFDRIDKRQDETFSIATKAHTAAKESSKQATLTNSRVTHLEQAVKEDQKNIRVMADKALKASINTRRRLLGIEKVVLPNKAPEPEQLKEQVKATPFWQDPFIRRILIVVGGIIILAAIGFSNDEIKGFFGD